MNNIVFFKKLNNTHGQVICDNFDTVIKLRDHLSHFSDGYQFHPSYKSRFWDGKVRMLKESGQIYLGLWREVLDYCKKYSITFKLDPQINRLDIVDDEFNDFVKELNVHTGGESIFPYDYQVSATIFALRAKRCILLSPTSSGKSLIQYMLLRTYIEISDHFKLLIVVPTVGLVTQMLGDFKDYSSHIDWDAESNIHCISGGKSKEDKNKSIYISTYQSLAKVPDEYFQQFTHVMVDECHTASAKSIIRILDNCVNAEYRVGLTGTLDSGDCKTNRLTLQGLFGPIKTVITTKELMDAGTVAQLKVKVGVLKHSEERCKFLRSAPRGPNDENGKPTRQKATYAEEIDVITLEKARNRFIMRFTASLKGNTILMINKVEHGENLFNWMKKAYPERNIYLYTGATDSNLREEIRNRMENEDGSIIIGSLGVLSTGISIKRLHNLVMAHPSKSRIKVLQSVGRLLRKSKFGNEVTMYDLVDDFCVGAYENYTIEHGRKRIEYYYEQSFDTEVINISLEGQ